MSNILRKFAFVRLFRLRTRPRGVDLEVRLAWLLLRLVTGLALMDRFVMFLFLERITFRLPRPVKAFVMTRFPVLFADDFRLFFKLFPLATSLRS